MDIKTRSQAKSGQPSELVSSPRAYHPRRSDRSRQGKAVVIRNTEVGAPSFEVANGTSPAENNFNVAPCGASLCKTCDILITSKEYKSNVTDRMYPVLNHSGEDLSCRSQNLIYLLSCKNCNLQYIGETVLSLNRRMNLHRTSTKGCLHVIRHFRETCSGSSFSIQIIEKFKDNGYNSFGKVDNNILKVRQNKEDEIIKTMRVVYPYGLNSKVKKNNLQDELENVGRLYPALPRYGTRDRSYVNRNSRESAISCEEFFEKTKDSITTGISGFLSITLENF